MSEKDIVKTARVMLAESSRIHALNDADPKKDEDVGWLLSALADEVEALRRGEFICQRCHHRKDSESEGADF